MTKVSAIANARINKDKIEEISSQTSRALINLA